MRHLPRVAVASLFVGGLLSGWTLGYPGEQTGLALTGGALMGWSTVFLLLLAGERQ